LDSITRSPIFAHFSESLHGVTTIRSYQQTSRFIYDNDKKVNENLKAYYPSVASNRWLAVRLEFIGSLVILGSALFAVLGVVCFDKFDAGLAGLCVSYALQVTQALNWMVRQSCEIEANIVSVERIKEYLEIDHEGLPVKKQIKISLGTIEFQNYFAKYREDLEFCLQNLSVSIKGGEKVGIVGRTVRMII
jgi:ATP-binding cassette subfamily C (CFTR/MRP) protein 1